MGAVYEPAAHINRRTIPAVQIQNVDCGRAASDVDDGVDSAYFVKMDLFRWNPMDSALCLRQQAKGAQGEVTSARSQLRVGEQAADLGQAPSVLMRMMMLGYMLMVVIMVMVMMVMVIMIVRVLDRPGRGSRLMQLAVDHDVDLGRLNAAPAHPANS